MSQIDLKIGPKIRAFRRQLGLQANKLAEDLSISPSYLNLIESGKRKIDGDLLLNVCEKLNIQLSDLTSKTDINLQNTISEILDDTLFEDLDILGPEVKDLVSTNPKIGKAIVRLGDILKKKDHELISKIEKISGKIVDNRKNSFPGEVVVDFFQENKNYFPKLEEFANKVFKIRYFEESLDSLFQDQKIFGTFHRCIGQEAVAVAFTEFLDNKKDFVVSNHRNHGHYLAYKEKYKRLYDELGGKDSGVSLGNGGSQVLMEENFFSNGILGTTTAIATGIAMGFKLRKLNNN